MVAGAVLVLFRPASALPARYWLLSLAFLGSCAFSLLPHELLPRPEWRVALEQSMNIPLSATISVSPEDTLFWLGIVGVSVFVGLFVSAQPLRSRQLMILAVAAQVAVTVYAGLAMYSQTSGWKFPFDTGESFGFFPNRNHTASFLLTGFVLGIGILGMPAHLRHWRLRVVAGIGVAVCVAALLFFTGSRGGVIFIPVALMLWLLGCGPRHWTRGRAMPVVGALVAGVCILLFVESTAQRRVLTFSGIEESRRARLSQEVIDRVGQDQKADVLSDMRLFIFRDTLGLVRDYPFTGAGLGTFRPVFRHYRDISLHNAEAAHPESDWLMLLSEAGAPAVLAALALLFTAVRPAFSGREDAFWPLRWAIVCAALIVLLHGTVDVPMHHVPLGWWALLLGLIGCQHLPRKTTRSGHWRRAVFLCAGVAAIVLGAALVRAEWFGGGALPPYAPAQSAQKIEELFAEDRWEEAVSVADQAIERFPTSSGLYRQSAALLLNFEEMEEEVNALLASERLLDPYWPETPVEQGRLLLERDPARTAELWIAGVQRQQRIDQRAPTPRAAAFYQRLVREAKGQPILQDGLLSARLGADLLFLGLVAAEREVASAACARLAADSAFLGALTPEQRHRFIALWLNRGPLEEVQQFASAHADWQDALWPLGIKQLVEAKRFEEAVRQVCTRFAISMEMPAGSLESFEPVELTPSDDPAIQFQRWWQRGNEITARRILKEAKPAGPAAAELYRWRALLAIHDGNWPAAWSALQQHLQLINRPLW